MAKQRRTLGFIALILAMFVGMLDSTITNIAVPDIMTSFKSNLNDVSWVTTIYIMGLGIFMITASKLADQFGRKKLMIVGLLLFGISSALCGLSKISNVFDYHEGYSKHWGSNHHANRVADGPCLVRQGKNENGC